jgi:hypothetical protein
MAAAGASGLTGNVRRLPGSRSRGEDSDLVLATQEAGNVPGQTITLD